MPVKQVVKRGADVDFYQLLIMRHHEMDGGPCSTLSTIARDRKSGIYNCSYHRMEIKSKNRAALYASPRHLWRIHRDYKGQNLEMPVATVLGQHPPFTSTLATPAPSKSESSTSSAVIYNTRCG